MYHHKIEYLIIIKENKINDISINRIKTKIYMIYLSSQKEVYNSNVIIRTILKFFLTITILIILKIATLSQLQMSVTPKPLFPPP